MNKTRAVLGFVVVLTAAAYLAGYWPERQRRVALEAEVAILRPQLVEAQAKARLAVLLDDLLTLTEAVASLNYGQAQELSSEFFDRVQAESAGAVPATLATALSAVAQHRDEVTATLARGDASALDPLRQTQLQLRQALAGTVTLP